MNAWLEQARRKSPAEKNKIALIAAGAITLLIVGLWVLLIRNDRTPETAKSNSTSESLKPLFMIFKSGKDGFNNVKSDIKSYKASTKDAVPAPASDAVIE